VKDAIGCLLDLFLRIEMNQHFANFVE